MGVVLQTAPIDPGACLTRFTAGRRETGAVVSFTGLMRADAGAAQALELDAYPGFTEAEIARFVADAHRRFPLDDVLVVHRHGRITPGEPIVFVATASAHRRAAFEAADFLMDHLKSRAPLWKRSVGRDGAHWVEPTGRDRDDAASWDAQPPIPALVEEPE